MSENQNLENNVENSIKKLVDFLKAPEGRESLAEHFKDYFQKQNECGNQGHPNAVVHAYSGPKWRAYMYCPDCEAVYERLLTPEEKEKINKDLSQSMTI